MPEPTCTGERGKYGAESGNQGEALNMREGNGGDERPQVIPGVSTGWRRPESAIQKPLDLPPVPEDMHDGMFK